MRLVKWKKKPFKDTAPKLLLSAALAPSLAYFQESNPWTAKIPIVRFGTVGTPILANTSGPIHSVSGFTGPLPIYEGDDIQGQFEHITKTAQRIAQRVKGPVWEVCADASFGFLAIGAACAGAETLALADANPSAPTMIMADAFGVDIDVLVAPV